MTKNKNKPKAKTQ